MATREIETGIRQYVDGPKKGAFYCYVQVGETQKFKRYKRGTALKTMRRWREEKRYALELQADKPAAETMAADIPRYLEAIADRPLLFKDHRRYLEWWAGHFGQMRRHAITSLQIRVKLVEARTAGRSPSWCKHCREALRSFYVALDGKHAQHPLRDVPVGKQPKPHARGVSYDLIRLVLDHVSDRGGVYGGKKGEGGYRAQLRGTVTEALNITPRELSRASADDWDRSGRLFIVRDAKGAFQRAIELTDAQIAVLTKFHDDAGWAKARLNGSRAKARLRVIAFTGCRPSELKRMLSVDWRRDQRALYVRTGKNGEMRVVPLTDDAMDALAEFDRLDCWNRPFSNSTVGRAWRQAMKAANVSGIRPYDLRHSFGTWLYAATGDLDLVADMMGHIGTRMTKVYTLGAVPVHARLAMDRFAEMTKLGSGSAPDVPREVGEKLKLIAGGRF